MRTKIVEGKTYGWIEDMRLWPKNPRTVEDKDLERLENQITELGLYKPLLVTADGEILGGNQRFKCLSRAFERCETDEQREGHGWVWVSIVDAWKDDLRLKYALSDNDMVGKYSREKVLEILKPLSGQESLFENYNLQLEDDKTLKQISEEISFTEKELRLKQIKKDLIEAGVSEDAAEQVILMGRYNRNEQKLEEINIIGEGYAKEVITFWFKDHEQYEKVKKIFAGTRAIEFNVELLIEILKKQGYDV